MKNNLIFATFVFLLLILPVIGFSYGVFEKNIYIMCFFAGYSVALYIVSIVWRLDNDY